MEYSPSINKHSAAASKVHLKKQEDSSEALQDLIDILKQNYVSDCPECAGSGITLKNRACKPCQGMGKSLSKPISY